MSQTHINLFFLFESKSDCILTVNDEIKQSHWQKITCPLENSQEWERGFKIKDQIKEKEEVKDFLENFAEYFSDERFFFIRINQLPLFNKDCQGYLPVPKNFLDGEDHLTNDLIRSIDNFTPNIYLFTKYIEEMEECSDFEYDLSRIITKLILSQN